MLKENNFSALDRDNLIEELESMGRSEKRAIESNLRVLLMHLLKYQYQSIALRAREQGTGNREQEIVSSERVSWIEKYPNFNAYCSSHRSNSWLATIQEHRIRINKELKASPSLKRYFEQIFEETYQDARQLASLETGLPLEHFPVNCPFTPEQGLNSDFLPES